MHLIKYIIEHDGAVTINHEYTAEIKKNRPLVLEWFAGHDLVTQPTLDKIKINDTTFILREKSKEPEIKEGIAKLGTVLGHVRITNKKESYVAIKGITPTPTDTELPFAFLQCVALGDFENAAAMLSFEITDDQLREYFGEGFEVLINNYLDNGVSILPKDSDEAKTFTFEIKHSKIANIC